MSGEKQVPQTNNINSVDELTFRGYKILPGRTGLDKLLVEVRCKLLVTKLLFSFELLHIKINKLT